jgi:hypothetical protein
MPGVTIGRMRTTYSAVRLAAILIACSALAAPAALAQAPARSTEESKTTWYFYTVAWGHQDEFLDLFARNHYPLLKALEAAGHYSRVRTYVPTYHGDGRADWTFAVELVEPPNAPKVDEDALIKKLFPNQEKYKLEEQRRFEILIAHWDVPLNVVDLGKR